MVVQDGVFVNSVQEALDNTKRDEASMEEEGGDILMSTGALLPLRDSFRRTISAFDIT